MSPGFFERDRLKQRALRPVRSESLFGDEHQRSVAFGLAKIRSLPAQVVRAIQLQLKSSYAIFSEVRRAQVRRGRDAFQRPSRNASSDRSRTLSRARR